MGNSSFYAFQLIIDNRLDRLIGNIDILHKKSKIFRKMAYYFNPMMIDFVLLWSVNRVFTIQYLLAIKKSQQDIKRTNNRICQFWIYNQPQTFSNATQPKFLSWIKDLRRNKSTFLSACSRISIFTKMRKKWESFITGRHFEFLRATISSTLPPAIFTVICPYQFENSNTRHDTFAVTCGGPDSRRCK